MDVLLQQLGEDLVLAGQALLQMLDLLVKLALRAIHRTAIEGAGPVLKELLLPGVKQARLNPVLLAQGRDGFAFQQMQSQDFDFVFGTELPPLLLAHFAWPFYRQIVVSSKPKAAFSTEAQHD